MTLNQRLQNAFHALKGVSTHPEMDNRLHVYSGYAGDQALQIQDTADYGTVYNVYTWVNVAVRKTVQQLAGLPVQVVNDNGEEIPGHAITTLFEYANDVQSAKDIWTIYIINMLLYGEAPFEFVENGRGDLIEVWNRDPAKTFVVPDKSRPLFPTVFGYRFGKSDDVIPPEMVWMDKYYNPNNAWRGIGPITAAREGITIDMFSQAWTKNLLKNGAQPAFALIAPEGVTKTERDKYKEEFMRGQGGVNNSHEPVILEAGITDVKPLGIAPKDMQWLEQRKVSRDEVGAILGVPDEVMGYGKDTYENFNTAWEVWWKGTLKPITDHRDNSLQKFFTKSRPLLRPGETVKTDLSSIGALQDDITPKIENAVKLYSMGVPFQVIDERLGLEIGDFTPEPAPEPEQPPPPESEPDKDFSRFYSWKKIAINTAHKGKTPNKVFLSDDISLEDSYTLATVLGLCKNKFAVEAVFADLDSYLNKALLSNGAEVDPARLLLEGEFSPELVEWLEEQVQRISRGIQANANMLPAGPFWTTENKAMASFLVPYVNTWMDEAIATGAELLDTVALGIDADVNALAAEWAGKHGLNMAKGLNATTKELSRVRLQNWLVSDQPYSELVNSLNKSIAPKWRADLIASTEITNSYHVANEQIAAESDVIKGLVWLTANDERVCPICGPLHGARKNKGGVYPGGLSGPAAHPRCRCGEGYDI